MKKVKVVALIMVMVFVLAGCSNKDKSSNSDSSWTVKKTYAYSDIAKWSTMSTPVEGSGSGSVQETNTKDGYVTIQAADDGWGGLESAYFEIDLDKEPVILAKIFESPDGSNWGMKIIPENAIEDHLWGLYLVPDNNLKWNKYAGVDVTSVLDEDIRTIYGSKFNVKIWIYPAGGPEATVSVSEIILLNTK